MPFGFSCDTFDDFWLIFLPDPRYNTPVGAEMLMRLKFVARFCLAHQFRGRATGTWEVILPLPWEHACVLPAAEKSRPFSSFLKWRGLVPAAAPWRN